MQKNSTHSYGNLLHERIAFQTGKTKKKMIYRHSFCRTFRKVVFCCELRYVNVENMFKGSNSGLMLSDGDHNL